VAKADTSLGRYRARSQKRGSYRLSNDGNPTFATSFWGDASCWCHQPLRPEDSNGPSLRIWQRTLLLAIAIVALDSLLGLFRSARDSRGVADIDCHEGDRRTHPSRRCVAVIASSVGRVVLHSSQAPSPQSCDAAVF
jgi:hypothetical protein